MTKEENRVIKFWRGASKKYYWMLYSGNDTALCEGMNGYSTLTNAKRSARELFPTAQIDNKVTDHS